MHSFALTLRVTAVKVLETVPLIVANDLGGDVRSGGMKNIGMTSPGAFATEALFERVNGG